MKDKNELHTAIQTIKNGGIVIIPTDTIFGLSCDPRNKDAVKRLQELKKRDQKPFIILDSSPERLKLYFDFNDFLISFTEYLLKEELWPGRITVVSDKNPSSGYKFLSDYKKVAVRYTDFGVVRDITMALGTGIISTSVNISGEPDLNDIEMIISRWDKSVDHIYRGKTGGSKSSTIVELYCDIQKIRILRSSDKETVEIIKKKFEVI